MNPILLYPANTPNNKGYFTGQYLRLQTSCTPPSTGFQPVIQVINTSKTETLTAYLDNLDINLIDPNKYYNGAFLDGDETDPPSDKISIPSEAGPGVVAPSDLSIKVGQIDVLMEMVLIQPDTFIMGSLESEIGHLPNESPQHQVTITKPFYMGKYEVTQAQWIAVMGSSNNLSYFKGDNLPVEKVSWDDCQTFIQKLNALGQGTFRLPTEAEWEYACRAGTQTRFYWGDDSDYSNVRDYAWYFNNSSTTTHDVGMKRPNAWGLYDMSGNVWEWCQDWSDSYSNVSQKDPAGANNGDGKVIRGGSWIDSTNNCRSAVRYNNYPGSRYNCIGFRVVRTQ